MNTPDREDALTLEILEAIDERNDVTQRGLAQRCGVALGLANSYLRRCVRKGLVKIQQAPANRYFYYLTPKGFAEKSRLTAEYLSYSFTFYRRATDSCMACLRRCKQEGYLSLGVYGVSELAEVIALHAPELGLSVLMVVDPEHQGERFRGLTVAAVVPECGDIAAWILTGLVDPQTALADLSERVAHERLLVPSVLGLRR